MTPRRTPRYQELDESLFAPAPILTPAATSLPLLTSASYYGGSSNYSLGSGGSYIPSYYGSRQRRRYPSSSTLYPHRSDYAYWRS